MKRTTAARRDLPADDVEEQGARCRKCGSPLGDEIGLPFAELAHAAGLCVDDWRGWPCSRCGRRKLDARALAAHADQVLAAVAYVRAAADEVEARGSTLLLAALDQATELALEHAHAAACQAETCAIAGPGEAMRRALGTSGKPDASEVFRERVQAWMAKGPQR